MSTSVLVNVFTNQHFGLNRETTSIGRSSASDIILKDILVSRTHAIVHCVDGEYFIEDNESTNGTLHNDNFVAQRHQLRPGDRIRIGTTWFMFGVDVKDEGVDTEQIPAQSAPARVHSISGNFKTLLRQVSLRVRAAS